MTQKIDQFEVFVKMVKALEGKNYSQVKRADKLVREALLKNKERAMACGVLTLQAEDFEFINSLSNKLRK